MKNAVAFFFVVVAVMTVFVSVGCPAEKDVDIETDEIETVVKPTSSFELIGPSPEDIVSKTLPQHPAWAVEEGLEKVRITISFAIDTDGKVQPTMVVMQSSGNSDWDKAVQDALRKWEFTEAEELRKGKITFWFVLQ